MRWPASEAFVTSGAPARRPPVPIKTLDIVHDTRHHSPQLFVDMPIRIPLVPVINHNPSFFDGLRQVRGAGLLGRAGRRADHLPRPHRYHQAPVGPRGTVYKAFSHHITEANAQDKRDLQRSQYHHPIWRFELFFEALTSRSIRLLRPNEAQPRSWGQTHYMGHGGLQLPRPIQSPAGRR